MPHKQGQLRAFVLPLALFSLLPVTVNKRDIFSQIFLCTLEIVLINKLLYLFFVKKTRIINALLTTPSVHI